MCTHKDTPNDEVYETHYGCSPFLPPTLEKERERDKGRDVTVLFSLWDECLGGSNLGVILIKCIFISAILICMAQAIRVREGRNEQGENE